MGFGSTLSNLLSGSGSGFVQGLFGSDYLKDYKHASKTFLSDGYALAPQTKYLFHVYFTINTDVIPGLAQALGSSATDRATIGMMVKTADLPRFNIETSELNQYNRKRHVQTKIEYSPLNISFHDDGSDLVRSMWYNYYTYYFSDAKHSYDGIGTDTSTGLSNGPFDYNRRDIYDNLRSVNEWGYQGTGPSDYKPNFFKDIKIYGLNRGNFVQYTLINPTIIEWAHDQFDYSNGGGTMTNQMTIKYETVKYQRGQVKGGAVRGFADGAMYDTEPSKLSKPGSTNTIFGQGGLIDAGADIISDLQNGNILGAALTAGTAWNTYKDSDLGSMLAEEGVAQVGLAAVTALNNQNVQNAVSNFVFPKAEGATNSVPQATQTITSNNGYTSSTNWVNPNTGSTWVNPDDAQPKANRPTDVSSNGSVSNYFWEE
jgi:hypothetical protein